MSSLESIRQCTRTGNILKFAAMRNQLFTISPEEFACAAFDGMCHGLPDNVEPFLRILQSMPLRLVDTTPRALISFVSRICAMGHITAARAALEYAYGIIPMSDIESVNSSCWEKIILNIMINGTNCMSLAGTQIIAYTIEMLARENAIKYVDWEHIYFLIHDQYEPSRTHMHLPRIGPTKGITRTRALDDVHEAFIEDADRKCATLCAIVDACHAWGTC